MTTSLALAALLLLSPIGAHAERCGDLLRSGPLAHPDDYQNPPKLFRHLRALGAVHSVGRIVNYPGWNGHYYRIGDWDQLRPTREPLAHFLRDEELLSCLRHLVRNGLSVVVSSQIDRMCAFAARPPQTLFEHLAQALPDLPPRPCVGINALTHFFSLGHELIHHDDHVSGLIATFEDELDEEVPDLTVDEFQALSRYVVEARAYLAELAAFRRHTRLVEMVETEDGVNLTGYEARSGSEFAARERRLIVKTFNTVYAAPVRLVEPARLRRAYGVLLKYIPGFTEHFDADFNFRLQVDPPTGLLAAPGR